MHYCVEGSKGNEIRTARLRETLPQRLRSAQVWVPYGMARVFEVSDSYTCTPTQTFIIGMSHTCEPYQIRLGIDM